MDYDKYFSEMQSQLDKQFDEARRNLDQQLGESLSAYTQKQSDVEDFANSGCKFCPECGTRIEMEAQFCPM
jgi:NADH pyrophosphatase NudC (nudix superfamily)